MEQGASESLLRCSRLRILRAALGLMLLETRCAIAARMSDIRPGAGLALCIDAGVVIDAPTVAAYSVGITAGLMEDAPGLCKCLAACGNWNDTTWFAHDCPSFYQKKGITASRFPEKVSESIAPSPLDSSAHIRSKPALDSALLDDIL